MKTFLLLLALQALCYFSFAQNVGINTATPPKMLAVNGSVMVDPNNTNLGTLDSAALLFGTSNVGIFSNKNVGVVNSNGLDFWTNNTRRMIIASNGLVGINLGNSSPTAFLDVSGSVRARSSLTVNSGLTVDNNASIGGNEIVNGNLTVAGTASVGGKGIVRSNSATNLRMGFTSGSYSITLPAGAEFDITFNITSFSGTNSNVRVSICQFVPNANTGTTWGRITMTVHSIDDANNQCKIRFFNGSTANATMDGTLYLMSVATD